MNQPSAFYLNLVLAATLSLGQNAWTQETTEKTSEILVQFKTGASHTLRSLTRGSSAFSSVLESTDVSAVQGLQKFRFSSEQAAAKALAQLKNNQDVEFAEPNSRLRILDSSVVNDSRFDEQWSLQNSVHPGADIHVVPVWRAGITGSEEIKIAVVDTGTDFTHPELAEAVYVNRGEIPDNGIDDDGNGYIDDYRGFNAIQKKGSAMDDQGHGTFTAGLIGARGNNEMGISGVAQRVTIVPVKFLDENGTGTTADAVAAIEYAIQMKVRVINASWGGGEESQALKQAIEHAGREGILFVAAAGNSGDDLDLTPSFPASYDLSNVIAVGATTKNDTLAPFSCYGQSVKIAAPGEKILSTYLNSDYRAFSGTSAAAPLVSGAAALLLSKDSMLTDLRIKELLMQGADAISLEADHALGGGRLNIEKSLQSL